MATLEYWIQLENRPWDLCPNNIDRMTGQDVVTLEPTTIPVSVTLTSTSTGLTRTVTMFKPIRKGTKLVDALIYRRYKPPTLTSQSDAWTVPDDRKVNPWDLNELDPGEQGTMGTIPGPVIEAKVGDQIKIHFRNRDQRVDSNGMPIAIECRCHSVHPHGVVFKATSDGAYPLSPPDNPGQPVTGSPGPNETALWAAVPGFSGPSKQGDRVPPGGTFIYTWETHNWPSTAGVWLYHDHSICDMDNVERGAIGIIVIHNALDTDDVDIRDPSDPTKYNLTQLPGGSPTGSPIFHKGTHLDNYTYHTPPTKLLVLQLYHQLGDVFSCINGRQYLGNTPTIVSGRNTLMRFGVVGMGSEFHTFHLHGHRWVIPGADGNTPNAIQNSVQKTAVSQFEDTRTFGPANSFVFTINGAPGSFMRAGGPNADDSLGEWHMHCHVFNHMMMGMMGSLLIIKGSEPVVTLPQGVPCPGDAIAAGTHTVMVNNLAFAPSTANINSGDTVQWMWMASNHSVTADDGSFTSGVQNSSFTFSRTFTQPSGTIIRYYCTQHGTMGGGGMSGVVHIN